MSDNKAMEGVRLLTRYIELTEQAEREKSGMCYRDFPPHCPAAYEAKRVLQDLQELLR